MIPFDLSRLSDEVLVLLLSVLLTDHQGWLRNILVDEEAQRRRGGGGEAYLVLPELSEAEALTGFKEMTATCFSLEKRASKLQDAERDELLVAAELTHLLAIACARRLRDLRGGHQFRPN